MEEVVEFDITPDTHIIASIAAPSQKMHWLLALGELLDNAIDGGATTVAISFANGFFSIVDNGHGAEDAPAMITLGKHVKRSTTKLGRFGIGGKDAMIFIGGPRSTADIITVAGGVRRSINLNWGLLADSKKWKWQMRQAPAALGERGTKITIHPVAVKVPEGERWDMLMKDLGYFFSPAIKSGKQITVISKKRCAGPVPLERYKLPALKEHIDQVVDVDGKRARVYVGIIADGEANPRPGITYTHGHRVIMEATGMGCGEYNNRLIAGFVELGEGWVLTKNKDNITANKDELRDAVFAVLHKMLMKAASEAAVLHSQHFASELTRAFSNLSQPDKDATRDKGDKVGTVNPTNTGAKKTRAKKVRPGDSVRSAIRNGLRIDLRESPEDKRGTVGAVDSNSRPPMVALYNDHHFIARIEREKNVLAALAIVSSLLANHDEKSPNGSQLTLRGVSVSDSDRFMSGVSSVLSDVDPDTFSLPAKSAAGK